VATLRLLPRGSKRTLGRVDSCIYCDAVDGLTDEHIVPFALGGVDVLEAASCGPCARTISAVELRVARSPALWPLRRALALPSRRKRKQPDAFAARETIGNEKRDVAIPIGRFPLAVPFFVFDPPTFISGAMPAERTIGRVLVWVPKKLMNATALEPPMDLSAHDLARLLAKVGLGYAIAALGRDAFEEVFVRDLILGRAERGNEFVGSIDPPPRFERNGMHAHAVRVTDAGIVATHVQLFRPPHAQQPTPVYQVVVGRVRC
jgi:hypothetical protein